MAEALLSLTDDELIAGSSDDKIDRLLLLVRDGFKDLKDQLSAAQVEITQLKTENAKLKKDLSDMKDKQAKEQALTEYHSKKYNMIIHNIPEENEGSAWESNIDSIEKTYQFFSNVLRVEGARDMRFMNAHRIGSPLEIVEPTTKKTLRTRPLIVRFTSMPDKEKVQRHFSALSEYNRNISYKYHRVFVTDQLPKRMENQRKQLLGDFIQARKRKAKAKWYVDKTGDYCLKVDGQRVSPNE